MNTWLYVGGMLFIALYVAIQVPAVVWISRYFDLEEEGEVDPTGGVFEEAGARPHIPEENYEAVHVPGEDGEPPGSDRGVCAICGTENDPEYSYCGNCAAHL